MVAPLIASTAANSTFLASLGFTGQPAETIVGVWLISIILSIIITYLLVKFIEWQIENEMRPKKNKTKTS